MFTGIVIENEQASEPIGESVGKKKEQNKIVVPPVQMRSYVVGKTEDVTFKSLIELKNIWNQGNIPLSRYSNTCCKPRASRAPRCNCSPPGILKPTL